VAAEPLTTGAAGTGPAEKPGPAARAAPRSAAAGPQGSGPLERSGPVPPALGRPSAASYRPPALRRSAEASSAAYRADGGDALGWSVRAASVAGVRHRLAGQGPEDAYAWRIVDPGPDPGRGSVGVATGDGGEPSVGGPRRPTVIVAVADGVGSVEGSAVASAAAVDAVCDALAAELSRETARFGETALSGETAVPGATVSLPAGRGDRSASGAVAAPGGRSAAAGPVGAPDGPSSGAGGPPRLPGADPDDPVWRRAFAAADVAVAAAGGATTLVVAVVGGDRRGAVARVGDSTALVLDGDGWGEIWSTGGPEDGPLSTATAALPSRDGPPPAFEVAAVALDAGAALVLVTDGIADPLRDGPTTVAPALAEALMAAPSPLGLALMADFSRQGCFDDRTVVGLWAQFDPPRPTLGGVGAQVGAA
jgi:serine/threonine protein phosphatase PrpC